MELSRVGGALPADDPDLGVEESNARYGIDLGAP